VLERQGNFVFAGSIIPTIVLNLVFTVTFPGISIGGHIGGLIGGALVMLAITRFGRAHAFYGKPGLVGVLALVTVAAASVGIGLWAANAANCLRF
jgi:predicted alpha/beta hydrolase